VLAMLKDNPRKRKMMINKILIEISQNKVTIRKNKQVERKVKTRKQRIHCNQKSAL
jgi:hypothetical protein